MRLVPCDVGKNCAESDFPLKRGIFRSFPALPHTLPVFLTLLHFLLTGWFPASGRLTRTVLPDGTYTTSTYDTLGRVTRYEYDIMGRRTTHVLPEIRQPIDPVRIRQLPSESESFATNEAFPDF